MNHVDVETGLVRRDLNLALHRSFSAVHHGRDTSLPPFICGARESTIASRARDARECGLSAKTDRPL